MDYAALNSLMLTIEQIQLYPATCLIPDKEKHFASLHEKLGNLQEFLEKFSPKSNETTASLRRRITDLAYKAEDIADLLLINQRPENVDLQNIIDEFDSLINESHMIKDKLALEITGDEATKQPWNSLRAGSSKISMGGTLMVGFDGDFLKIKEQLTGDSSVLEVISIVGMGGIGKTTLATNIYNNPSIRRHFDIHAWATVSQSFCARDIILSILDSMINSTDEMHQESDDQLGLHLYKALKNRRYLIVIDDIWESDAWDGVRRMFPEDNNGSRIILTTRLHDVAAYASSSGLLHEMSLLSDDLSWILLCAKVFGEESCPLNLQEFGKKIAQNCRGLPLSIVVIGGLLSTLSATEEEWRCIAENVTSIVNSTDAHCLEILKLSYNYLPQRLKACFLYVGAFPEDNEISASKIIKLWIAESFIKQGHLQTMEGTKDGDPSLEEKGERSLKELADRSLILVSKQNFEGKIKRFRIHDLLRQVCVNEANNEKFLQVIKWYDNIFPRCSHGQRRSCIHPMRQFKRRCFLFKSMRSISSARSLLCMGNYSFPSNVFPKFKLLKVLDAIGVKFWPFPSEILELLNLRYIAFMYEGELPASISKLQNLQTLIIHQETSGFLIKDGSIYLPVEIWEIPRLRHVEFTRAYLLDPIGAPLDTDGKHLVLKELQCLSGIRNLRFTEALLKRITNIKKLDISYDDGCCWREKGWSYYHLDNLVNLHQLEALKVTVIPDVITLNTSLIPLPHKSAAFPSTLRTLTLSGWEIPWDELTVVSSLPNLEALTLKDEACVGTVWEPNESDFSKLKLLVLEGLYLKQWIADHDDHFPCLEHLIFRYCYHLEEIPDGMEESPTLAMIELDNSNVSLLTSAHNVQETQHNLGNDGFQVVVEYIQMNSHFITRAAYKSCRLIDQHLCTSTDGGTQQQLLESFQELMFRMVKGAYSPSNIKQIFRKLGKLDPDMDLDSDQYLEFESMLPFEELSKAMFETAHPSLTIPTNFSSLLSFTKQHTNFLREIEEGSDDVNNYLTFCHLGRFNKLDKFFDQLKLDMIKKFDLGGGPGPGPGPGPGTE